MSAQIRVGIFAVLSVIAVFVVWYVLSNYSLRRDSYSIAIHFRNVLGLQVGSPVQLAGVDVGLVDDIKLLPDQTASVICTINGSNTIYRGSKFSVALTLTGQSTLTITPPPNVAAAIPLPRKILPEAEQPEGTIPPTIADLVSEGQARIKELDKTLALVNTELPGMVEKFKGVATHTDSLIVHADQNLAQSAIRINGLLVSLDALMTENGRNVTAMTGSLRQLIATNQPKLNSLIVSLSETAVSINKTMATVSSIAQDPNVKNNILVTTANLKDSSEKLKAIATDIQSLTGDRKVQSKLRGAVDNLSSAIAKADDILGSFSGVQASNQEEPPGQNTPGQTPRQPAASPSPGMHMRGIRGFQASALAQAQVRETWGTHGGGPSSDLNIALLPLAATHVSFGANDLGYHTTYNFLIDRNASPRLQYSAGVLYSNLGLKTVYYPAGPLGLDARLYDAKHPKFDLYGNLRLSQRIQVFYGERSLFGPPATRAPSFGLQLNY